MPMTEADRLAACAAQAGVGLSPAQTSRLLQYLDLLERWNATYNLTAVRRREDMLVQHLVDCLAIVPALERRLSSGGRVLDVGSGGGLPGVVLATVLPALTVTCVDAVGKKAAFVRQVGGALGLSNLLAVHARVETLPATPTFDLVTCRAFSSLADLVRLTAALLSPGGCWLAMKGREPAEEIAALPADVEVFHVEHLQVPDLEAERCLVWIRPRTPASTPQA